MKDELKCTAGKSTCKFTHVSVQTAADSLMEDLVWHVICLYSFVQELQPDSKKDTKKTPALLHMAQIQAESHRLMSDQIKNECVLSNCWPT